MLKPDLITREELYEAVWTESVQTLAKALGISDVGLAKICKKLNVPRPQRGYWAKPKAARKLLKKPLPPLLPNQEETYQISQWATQGGPAWSREALKNLADEGVQLPSASLASSVEGTHPLIAKYRELLEGTGPEVSELLSKKACLAVSVSTAQLDRGLRILQMVFEAWEKQGYQPEVLPPNPLGTNRYGYTQAQPSRTGVRIKDIFVAFEIKEAYDTVEVPPQTESHRGGRRATFEPPARPTYRKVGSGRLTLEIVDPTPDGMRKRWHDRESRKIEDELNAFFRAAMAIAEHQHQELQERERQRLEKEAERRRGQEEAARLAELTSRMYDLESRMMDVQQARAIRNFVQAVHADAERRGLSLEPPSELGAWLSWANELANQLEQTAIQTLSERRRKPESQPAYGFNQAMQTEAMLRSEVDLWQRRYIYGCR